MIKQTLALCLIVKDDAEEKAKAKKAIDSVRDFVDAIYVTENGAGETRPTDYTGSAKTPRISYFHWVDDFAACRNYNFSQAKEDWILWLDADDVVKNPEKIRPLIDQASKSNISAYYAKYLYDKDDKGRVTAWHWKVRLIKNDVHGKWAGRIHEDFLQDRQVNWIKQEDFVVDHNTNGARRQESVERNFRILADEVKKQGDNPDPRTLFYLGTAFMQLQDWQSALDTFNRYLELSGWDEERYEALLRIGEVLEQEGKIDDAKDAYLRASAERPDFPEAYFNLARIYQAKEEWKKSIEWSEVGLSKKPPETNILVFPQKLTWLPLSVYGYSLMQAGKLDKAVQILTAALKYAPDEEYIRDLYQRAVHVLNNKEMLKWYVKLAEYLRTHGQSWRVPALITSIPQHLQENVIATKLKQDFNPAPKFSDKSIVFYCGLSAEPWSPKSLDQGGIGGSETAVIHLAKRLAHQGWEVTVYNWCDTDDGVYDGVTYKNYWSFQTNAKFNIVVLWRTPLWLDVNIDAKKVFIDMHDVPNPAEFTEERLAKITKIMVKSQYHRELFPGVPDEKFAIIPNGIDVSRYAEEIEKIPHSAIYSSAPNRGLDILLKMWPTIRKQVPDATLRIFYGWKTYFELQKNDPNAIAWMQKMKDRVASMADQGVIDMGRVGQKELAQWQKKSSVWLYPTSFQEISCITAMEVQAANCLPVCSDFAALRETVHEGFVVPGDSAEEEYQATFIRSAVRGMTEPMRDSATWVKQTFSWDAVTNKWDELLRA